jgi:hypothetical protein
VEDGVAPQVGEPLDLRQDVPQARCDEEPARPDGAALVERDLETSAGLEHPGVDCAGPHDRPAEALHLLAAEPEQLGRVEPVAREVAVHVPGEPVPRLAAVDDEDGPSRLGEHERGIEAGRPTADDDDVPEVLFTERVVGSGRRGEGAHAVILGPPAPAQGIGAGPGRRSYGWSSGLGC